MAEFKEQVLDILEEVCENDIVKENLDVQLFEEGILDSFAVVSLLVEFQERFYFWFWSWRVGYSKHGY